MARFDLTELRARLGRFVKERVLAEPPAPAPPPAGAPGSAAAARAAPAPDLAAQVLRRVQAYRESCVIAAAVELGVFEALTAGPRSADALAAALGTDAAATRRLLQALAALGLVARDGASWSLGEAGRQLLADRPAGAWALLAASEYLPAWSELGATVRSGRPSFERVMGVSAWQHRADHPRVARAFDLAMTPSQRRSGARVAAAIAADTAADARVVDVGGGLGFLLSGVLEARPAARGVLFDLPHVAARARETFAAAGLAERVECVGGSFFEAIPSGDVLLLMHVLHDWDDDAVRAILARCRAALGPGGRLVVGDACVRPEVLERDAGLALLDLHMMVVLGGRERSFEELSALLAEAGFGAVRRLSHDHRELELVEARA
ncbi:MAG: methyltransferase [Myxococcota bacterium]